MATTPSFYEVVVNGSPKIVRGLLTGLALGAGLPDEYWFHRDHDVVDPTTPRTVRRAAERLHLMPTATVRVVVPGELAKLLRARKKAIAVSGLCEIEAIDRIKQAQVEIKYHTYARRYDDEVQTLLTDLPRGIKLMNPVHKVEEHPEAKGSEGYAPAHHFESEGGGILLGRFDLVLDLRDRYDVHPLIECETIELVTT